MDIEQIIKLAKQPANDVINPNNILIKGQIEVNT